MLIVVTAKCDTITYWHVYVNKVLIADFNQYSSKPKVALAQKDYSINDTINVTYTTCISRGEGSIIIKDSNQQIIATFNTSDNLNYYNIPISSIINRQSDSSFTFHHLSSFADSALAYLFELNFK